MKPVHYLAVIVRLFAIGLFVYAIRHFGLLIESFFIVGSNEITLSNSFLILTTIIPLVAAVIIWCFPLTIASKILGAEDDSFKPVAGQDLFSIIIASIGVYCLYISFADVIFWLAYKNIFSNEMYASVNQLETPAQDKANMLSTAFEVLVSLFLIFKSKSLAMLITKYSK